MEGIKIHKKPRLRNPCMICAWPGMGEVAFKAASYLVEQLKAEEFAEILPEDFFYLTTSMVREGVLSLPEFPYGKFYYWKNPLRPDKSVKNTPEDNLPGDLVIFISNAQPDLAKVPEYAQRIILIAREMKVKTIINFAAMPQPIEHTQASNVWFAATSVGLKNTLKNFKLNLLTEGQISGMNGLFLGIAKREGFEGFCLLAEIPLYTIQIDNPKASCAIIEAFAAIFNISVDLKGLKEQAHIMEEEINKFLEYLRAGAPPGPINEEEIERIKKSLSQFTKLPASVKEKIEVLFTQAKSDISKAKELKVELDKWNVYKDYEDRFLDLFKRKKEGNN